MASGYSGARFGGSMVQYGSIQKSPAGKGMKRSLVGKDVSIGIAFFLVVLVQSIGSLSLSLSLSLSITINLQDR